MSTQLSKQLESFRHRLHEHSLHLVVAARSQDREGIRDAQNALSCVFDEWDKLIAQVAQLEAVTYNSAEILALCHDNEDE